ncbi:GyrI-like domain-containing protein [Gorillibacterium sp. sgz5001074]|uniref:GyrI-like domain-containing protein n=1 Tax=Gorillibacterium sp. sgz5001074 TaxID=3446695 RepID=UPI003F677169
MKLTVIQSVRTNNFNDDQLMQKITGLWQEASLRLTDRDLLTYGVYHDYESDYKGDYTLSVAVEDRQGESTLEIPDDARYEIFPVDATDEQGVIRAWNTIWERENSGTLHRAYTYDYEKYDPRGQIEIYIAIK